jgi:lipoprotein-anchoring transpeptidase ErfK/SrfK
MFDPLDRPRWTARRFVLPAAPLAARWRSSNRAAIVAAAAVCVAVPATALADAAAPAASTPAATTSPAATTPAGTTPGAAAPAATTPVAPADPPATTDDEGLIPTAATRAVSYAARLVVPVVVRKTPSRKGKRVTSLKPFGSWNGGPVVLQIAEVKVVDGKRWLRVRLPIRPNNATGWLPQSSVEVRKLRYRILVSRKLHKLTLLRDGKKVASTRVVIGAPSTPTPKGTFAVLEVVKQPKGEDIGPWALHLTAHSNVLDNFGGGPGRVALHGRAGDLLNDPLGSSRSHGCVRMSNTFITRLHSVATEGTPVVIS